MFSFKFGEKNQRANCLNERRGCGLTSIKRYYSALLKGMLRLIHGLVGVIEAPALLWPFCSHLGRSPFLPRSHRMEGVTPLCGAVQNNVSLAAWSRLGLGLGTRVCSCGRVA